MRKLRNLLWSSRRRKAAATFLACATGGLIGFAWAQFTKSVANPPNRGKRANSCGV